MSTLFNLLLASLAVAASSEAATPPIDAAKVFAAKCASCHGKDAKGNPLMAKTFHTAPARLNLAGEDAQKKTDAELAQIVAAGKGKMPAFKEKLKKDEISGLVAYLRTLTGKESRK